MIVLCGLELHRGRVSGKKEGRETFDTMEPQGQNLCEAANISDPPTTSKHPCPRFCRQQQTLWAQAPPPQRDQVGYGTHDKLKNNVATKAAKN